MLHQNSQPPEAARVTCRKFDQELSAYLEGEGQLDVPTHARECPYCAAVLADLEQIHFASRHLSLEEPPARVWANIRATLADEGILHEQVPAWHRWVSRLPLFAESVPVGALACLAFLALTLLTIENQGRLDTVPGDQQVVAAGMFSTKLDSSMARTLRDMEQAYLAQEDSLEPPVKAAYRKSLQCLNADIEECRRHCLREPHDTLARQYLARAYQSKVEVLASAVKLSSR